jgi:hypothetical protein
VAEELITRLISARKIKKWIEETSSKLLEVQY